jgi:hypothetical protein
MRTHLVEITVELQSQVRNLDPRVQCSASSVMLVARETAGREGDGEGHTHRERERERGGGRGGGGRGREGREGKGQRATYFWSTTQCRHYDCEL